MLHLLYILAFSGLALFAVGNLIRNLLTLGAEADRANAVRPRSPSPTITLHPEMLDQNGQILREPLLVMKSISVDDARDRLNALYEASPGGGGLAGEPED